MQSKSKFKANLLRVRSLQDGWLDGEGKAPTVELLDWFEGWFLSLWEKHNLGECPDVFPEFKGGLVLEWFYPQFQPSLSIEPNHQSASFHFIDSSSPDGYCEVDIDLTDPADMEWVTKLRHATAVGVQG